jgi:formyltetrahydrofolate hydrolase
MSCVDRRGTVAAVSSFLDRHGANITARTSTQRRSAASELDAGPIIEQGVHRISHHDPVDDVTRIGRDVERTVLAKTVRWHLDERVLVNGAATIVF